MLVAISFIKNVGFCGSHKCEWLWNEHICVSACLLVSTKLDYSMNGRFVGQPRRLRTWAGVLDGQSICTTALESTDEWCCAHRECQVCAFTSDLLSLPVKKEGALGWLCLYFMQVLYVSAVEGSASFVEVYVTGCVSVLCVCVSVFMCTCVSGTSAQLCYWLNMQTGKQQPSPSDWTETLGPWAVGCAPVAEQENPGLQLQKMVSAPNVS